MQITVDATATLHTVTKTEQALEDLKNIFEECDLATYTAAAALDSNAPALSDSLRDVAAREGGYRTKPFAQAESATQTLRGTVADFVRYSEDVVEDLERLRDAVINGAENLLNEAGKVVNGVIEGVKDFGDDVQDFGEDVLEGAQDVGEDLIEGAQDFGDGLRDGAKKVGDFFGL